MKYSIIPSEIHGYLDYLLAIFCCSYTFISGLYVDSYPAFLVSIGASVFFVAQASITDFKPSIVKIVPMKLHLFNDTVAAIVFLVTPVVCRLQGLHLLYFLTVAVGILVVGFTTQAGDKALPASR